MTKLDSKVADKIAALNKIGEHTEAQVIQAYQGALKEIRSTLGEAYEKFDKVDMATMQKYNRLEAMEKEIQEQLTAASMKSSTHIRRGVKETYEESFYRTGYQLETEAQMKLAFMTVDPKVIREVVNNDMSGMRWIERMGRNRSETMFQVKQELAQGLIQGESYTKMSRRLKERVNVDANKALTIARTEAGRARSKGTFDGLEHAAKMGLDIKKRWLSVFDDNTRHSHQMLDGEVVDLDKEFSNGLMYPKDPMGAAEEVINCRCEVVADFAGLDKTSRRARGEGLVEYGTYRDWKANRLGKRAGRPTATKAARTIGAYKDFKEMRKHFSDNYKIDVDKQVENLDYDTVSSALTGVEKMIKDYPMIENELQEVKVEKIGVMATNGKTLYMNPAYFDGKRDLEAMFKRQSEIGHWVKNATMESVAAHEMGHVLNMIAIRNIEGIDERSVTADWNSRATARKIVSEASGIVKKAQPSGEKQRYAEIREDQSKYGATNAAEAIAEAFADEFANGANMHPLSKAIVKIFKDKHL